MRAASTVRDVAVRKGATAGQIALVAAAQGDDFVPIPGTKRRKYLEENVAAADVRPRRMGWRPYGWRANHRKLSRAILQDSQRMTCNAASIEYLRQGSGNDHVTNHGLYGTTF